MNNRIRQVRQFFNLTMEQFGESIGIKRSSVSLLESGSNNPSRQTILAICRVYNVNEDWLVNGTGEMLSPVDRELQIALLVRRLLDSEPDSFQNRLITALSKLTIDQWKLLENIADTVLDKKKD